MYTKQYRGDFPHSGEDFVRVCPLTETYGTWREIKVGDDPQEAAAFLEEGLLIVAGDMNADIFHMQFMFKPPMPYGYPDDPLPQRGFVAAKMYIRKKRG